MIDMLLEIIEPRSSSSIILVEEALLEDISTKKLTHLHHLEDAMIVGGDEGFQHSINLLRKTHEHLKGNKPSNYSITTKMDGNSIVWGTHPETKKFFVGSKSFFNKTPKINYTDADIDANHGSKPGLAKKLKASLKFLKNVTPPGVYQGDLMYLGDEVAKDGNTLSFSPNVLRYHTDASSSQGKAILQSKIGIAPHTQYRMGDSGDLEAVYNPDLSNFKNSAEVNVISNKLKGPFKYHSKDVRDANEKIGEADRLNKQLAKSGAYETLKSHSKTLLAYMNHTVKRQTSPSTAGYISFLNQQFNKHTENLVKDSSKAKLRSQLDKEMANISTNKKTFETLFKAHRSLQDAKNTMVNALSKNSPWKETILGNPSKPEGFVVTSDNVPMKFVDRNHFSVANFDWNEKVNPEDNPTVLSFGRFNPPTAGHERMINYGADLAQKMGAKHKVVASRSKDSTKNPLTHSQKMSYLKSLFPGQDVTMAGQGEYTLIAQLQALHNQGVKDLTLVAGSDRVPGYKDLIAKYNGPGKLFNFNRTRVISAGERDTDADDVGKVSASQMRAAAKKNNFKEFQQGTSKSLGKSKTQELFHNVRAEMGAVKIGHDTAGHALAIYAQRKDKLGKEAQDEISRRKRHGTWTGK